MAGKDRQKAPKAPSANEGRRYRLYPEADVDVRMTGWGHTRRALYNLALEQRQMVWRTWRQGLNFAGQDRFLTQARAEIDWVRDFPSVAAQQTLRQLDQAYANWWNPNHPAGPPRFQARSATLSFRLPGQVIAVERLNRHWGRVRLPKVGWVRFRWTRPLDGTVRNATVTKKAGQWHVAFGVATDRKAPPANTGTPVGVDFGVACSAYVYGENAPRLMAPSLTDGEQRRLLGLERRMARQLTYARRHNAGRYSKRLRRSIDQIAALRTRQARRRQDFTHRLTTDLAQNHSLVAIEDLKVNNMTRSVRGTVDAPGSRVAAKAGLNRAVLDNCPGERRRQLEYKCAWYGSQLSAVPAPRTSQTCTRCGAVDPASRPGCGREFACTSCGHTDHADHNAAGTILQRAIEALQARQDNQGQAGGQPVTSTGRRRKASSRRGNPAGGSVNPQQPEPAHPAA